MVDRSPNALVGCADSGRKHMGRSRIIFTPADLFDVRRLSGRTGPMASMACTVVHNANLWELNAELVFCDIQL